MIVVDIGCMGYEAEVSIDRLIATYRPDVFYGFDPHPNLQESISVQDGTTMLLRRMAAWSSDGTLAIHVDGTKTKAAFSGEVVVPCFDLADWLNTLPDTDIVLKLDCEGAEYLLLTHLIRRHADARLNLILVEWHDGRDDDAHRLTDTLTCDVEVWG